MPFVSITRLRIRSIRFLPFFAFHAVRSNRQVARAHGFHGGSLLPDRQWTYWTMTIWDSMSSMRQFMTEGPHRAAMPHLLDWCDEASAVHWERTEDGLPSWEEADRRMREQGRVSKVRYPSPSHADMGYRAPRLTGAAPLRKA